MDFLAKWLVQFIGGRSKELQKMRSLYANHVILIKAGLVTLYIELKRDFDGKSKITFYPG